jgi:hypothetical protein
LIDACDAKVLAFSISCAEIAIHLSSHGPTAASVGEPGSKDYLFQFKNNPTWVRVSVCARTTLIIFFKFFFSFFICVLVIVIVRRRRQSHCL